MLVVALVVVEFEEQERKVVVLHTLEDGGSAECSSIKVDEVKASVPEEAMASDSVSSAASVQVWGR